MSNTGWHTVEFINHNTGESVVLEDIRNGESGYTNTPQTTQGVFDSIQWAESHELRVGFHATPTQANLIRSWNNKPVKARVRTETQSLIWNMPSRLNVNPAPSADARQGDMQYIASISHRSATDQIRWTSLTPELWEYERFVGARNGIIPDMSQLYRVSGAINQYLPMPCFGFSAGGMGRKPGVLYPLFRNGAVDNFTRGNIHDNTPPDVLSWQEWQDDVYFFPESGAGTLTMTPCQANASNGGIYVQVLHGAIFSGNRYIFTLFESPNNYMSVYANGNEQFILLVVAGGSLVAEIPTDTGKEGHIGAGARWSGGNIEFYFNGNKIGTGTMPQYSGVEFSDAVIGFDPVTTTGFYNDRIAYSLLWNTPISAHQMRKLTQEKL